MVRLEGVLTAAELRLAKSPSDKARGLLEQVRSHLIETAKPLIQAMVQEITGVKRPIVRTWCSRNELFDLSYESPANRNEFQARSLLRPPFPSHNQVKKQPAISFAYNSVRLLT